VTSDVAVIDRMAVRWRAHGFTGVGAPVNEGPGERLIDPARLDSLISELLAGPLEDALAATVVDRDEIVCLRSVTVPPTTVSWDRPEAEIVATWARAAAEAVAGSITRAFSSEDVVRYTLLGQAVSDLVVRFVVGDVRRAWAWRQIGILPAAHRVEAMTGDELAVVAAQVLADHPEQIVPALASLARSGRLSDAVAYWGVDRTVALVAAAWAVHGGDRLVVTGDFSEDLSRTTVGVRVDLTMARSIIARAAVDVIGPPALGDVGGSGPGEPAASGRARLARALAVAAVLDGEPSVVRRGAVASAVVAALTGRLTDPDVVSTAARKAAADAEPVARSRPTASPSEAAEPVGETSAGALTESPTHESIPAIDETEEPSGAVAPTATTAWGGLLFLLHLVDDLIEQTETDSGVAPVLVWPPTRPGLHRLARTLASRALPDVDPPRPDDPAVLAFAGLAPDAVPPEPGSDDEPPLVTTARAEAVTAVLRARLVGSTLHAAPEAAVLAAVVRRSARITADPGWVDVAFDLDQISIAVRRAGLDLDPGWVPWLGRVVRFRYV
jgi:hypothetical protein